MPPPPPNARHRFQCDHQGCKRSYLRLEHLNRHNLTHKERNFACYFCKRQFTRNDLLQVHLRRHESRSFENIERVREKTPSHQGHRDALLRKTNPLWDDALPYNQSNSPLSIDSAPSIDGTSNIGNQATLDGHLVCPGTLPGSAVSIPDVTPEAYSQTQIWTEDYNRLLAECPGLVNLELGSHVSMQQLFKYGMAYMDTCMPFCHQPTFRMSPVSPLFFLSVCCLGGFLNPVASSREMGFSLQKYIWRRTHSMLVEQSTVDVSILQSILVIEHVRYYAMTYEDHKMANLMHGVTIALVRRQDIFSQAYVNQADVHEPLDTQWKNWAKREEAIRLAYCVFTNDISQAVHFMHPKLLSARMLKLPPPCSSNLWRAKSAEEWKAEVVQCQNHQVMSCVEDYLEVLLGGDGKFQSHLFMGGGRKIDTLTMHILIHGLLAEILELNTGTLSASSKAIRLLKVDDINNALTRWLQFFVKLSHEERESEIGVSSLIYYHLARSLTYMDLSSILRAAGVAEVDLSSSADEEHPMTPGVDVHNHVSKIIRLCIMEPQASSSKPLERTYTAFLAALLLRAHIIGIGKIHLDQDLQSQDISSDTDISDSARILINIIDGEYFESSSRFDVMKADLQGFIVIIRNKLAGTFWEIGRNASQILEHFSEETTSVNFSTLQ